MADVGEGYDGYRVPDRVAAAAALLGFPPTHDGRELRRVAGALLARAHGSDRRDIARALAIVADWQFWAWCDRASDAEHRHRCGPTCENCA